MEGIRNYLRTSRIVNIVKTETQKTKIKQKDGASH